jgi:hypothetical protein
MRSASHFKSKTHLSDRMQKVRTALLISSHSATPELLQLLNF